MVAHLRPPVSSLKAAFVFLGTVISRPLYDITAMRHGGLVAVCGFRFNHHPFPPTIFLSLHSLINVLCALWRCIIHQTEWPGSVRCQPPRLLSLPLPFTCCYWERRRIFHLLSVGNILRQSNNLFSSPLLMSNNVSSKGNDKGVQATGVALWLFWSGWLPLTSVLRTEQPVGLPTLAASHQVMRGFFGCPHQPPTA